MLYWPRCGRKNLGSRLLPAPVYTYAIDCSASSNWPLQVRMREYRVAKAVTWRYRLRKRTEVRTARQRTVVRTNCTPGCHDPSRRRCQNNQNHTGTLTHFFHVLSIFAYRSGRTAQEKRSLGAYMSPWMATKEAFCDSLRNTAKVGTSLVYAFDMKTVVRTGRKQAHSRTFR